MEIGIGGTDALDWDIFLRGHGRRQMSKSEEVAAKINCSCDSQNTTRPAETKSKDFPFCRYFRKKAFNPCISHPNENKKVYDFLQVGAGLLIIFLACSNFWRKKKHFYSNIQIMLRPKKRSELLFWMILNYFEVVFHHRSCHFAHSFPSAHSPFRTKVSLLPTFYFLSQLFLAAKPPLNHRFNK